MSDSRHASRWIPRGVEFVSYVVLAIASLVSLALGLVAVQHDTGMFAVYTGGAPSGDSVFCAVPIAWILIVAGLLSYVTRRLAAGRGDSEDTGYFDEERV